MCGITGIFNFRDNPVSLEEIRVLTDTIAHRGRDSDGIVLGGLNGQSFSSYSGIALGHRRLSIIDLSESSSQPMTNWQKKLWIVYNGELYNYIEI